MNIKSWKLPIRSTLKQPVPSKATPPLRSQLNNARQSDEQCFERGYN